jgi:ankyrin repeat protein
MPKKSNNIFDNFKFSDLGSLVDDALDSLTELGSHTIKETAAKLSEINGGYSKLHTYTILGDSNRVYDLLEEGYSPDHKNDVGVTPSELAVIHGKFDILKSLLEHGADPNLRTTEEFFSPMHVLADCRDEVAALRMAKLLLNYGGRLDLKKGDELTVSEYLNSLNKNSLLDKIEGLAIDKTKHIKVVDGALGSKIDVVELRFSLNERDFDKVNKMLDESGSEYEAFYDWADNHSYSDVLNEYVAAGYFI